MPYSNTWLYTSSCTIAGEARNIHASRWCNVSGNVASSCGGKDGKVQLGLYFPRQQVNLCSLSLPLTLNDKGTW